MPKEVFPDVRGSWTYADTATDPETKVSLAVELGWGIESIVYAPKKTRGAHSLCAVIPDSDAYPIVLFCDRCGEATRHAIALPVPLDDLPSDAIARLARRAS